MVASAVSVPLSFSISYRNKTPSISLLSHRNSTRYIASSLHSPYGDSSATGLSSKTCGFSLRVDEKDIRNANQSYPAIEAKKGNPPIMPAVMTPGGPLDLSSVLFRNRIIFIGQPINSQVAQQVISQLVTLATIDEKADILMYLNCPGGSTYSVLAIYDCMSWGHVEDVRRQVNEAVQSRHKIDRMYAAFTGQPLEKVQEYTERDRFLSTSEAMEFGLIDGILETEY
ncbi:ATP-dependent Clp protease proteolytic subunit 6, chloroplastic isoform X2 [Hevea brasiliensis]|uniref:ATP-dependent Clp protease proteolytic subunit 6, chloroplastic isoform X2 n=1 Tax=Hevea brasiliensis TaxID=3981 RepID=UPI0025EAAAEC|nr:ATP-dependent Clp protease proteolytic subunit 6, chloroplastic isoform X2 [Hevea brasiliensis]